jgi:hypothetical protein
VFSECSCIVILVTIDNTLAWKQPTEQVLQRLSAACYALRSLKSYKSPEIMKLLYYIYFHSSMSYRILFWRNSTASTKVFRMQNRAIRIITRSKNKGSCRDPFKSFKILLFHSQYILLFLLFVVENKNIWIKV